MAVMLIRVSIAVGLALAAIQFVTGSVHIEAKDYFGPIAGRSWSLYDLAFLFIVGITLAAVHKLTSR
jgi:hypothetical protein